MATLPGFGPAGDHNFGIGDLSQTSTDELIGYPSSRNAPVLSKSKEYYFVLDPFQLAYQNCRAGISSKEYFLKRANTWNWNLSDTVYLSKKPIKVGFHILAGLDSLNRFVYCADANNNNDYSDDAILPLLPKGRYADAIVSTSVPVAFDYYLGGEIHNEKLLCNISGSSSSNISFGFPQFRYHKFKVDGESYLLAAEIDPNGKMIYLVPDQPNFSSMGLNKAIKLNQHLTINGKDFIFKSSRGLGNQIVLEGQDIDGYEPVIVKSPKAASVKSNNTVSAQTGFRAPEIKGKLINGKTGGEMLSLSQLKGKYVFVDFWSTTCIPCIAEFPNIKKAYGMFGRDKFEIIGVVDERQTGKTVALISKHNANWPTMLVGAGTVTTGYNIYSYPTSFLIDPDGYIVAQDLRGEELVNFLSAKIVGK
jgi:thiol-disulfide isomerase/thioredoxin